MGNGFSRVGHSSFIRIEFTVIDEISGRSMKAHALAPPTLTPPTYPPTYPPIHAQHTMADARAANEPHQLIFFKDVADHSIALALVESTFGPVGDDPSGVLSVGGGVSGGVSGGGGKVEEEGESSGASDRD